MIDHYIDPKTGCLKNKLGISETTILQKIETEYSAKRCFELKNIQFKKTFDLDHLKRIHYYIFQDVYTWAGQLRDVDIAKGDNLFARHFFLESAGNDIFRRLKKESFLINLDADNFASRAGFYLGEINALHPFREGNGRTQREFITMLAQHNSYHIKWGNISQKEMILASIESNKSNSDSLANLIRINLIDVIQEQFIDIKSQLKDLQLQNIKTTNKIIIKDQENLSSKISQSQIDSIQKINHQSYQDWSNDYVKILKIFDMTNSRQSEIEKFKQDYKNNRVTTSNNYKDKFTESHFNHIESNYEVGLYFKNHYPIQVVNSFKKLFNKQPQNSLYYAQQKYSELQYTPAEQLNKFYNIVKSIRSQHQILTLNSSHPAKVETKNLLTEFYRSAFQKPDFIKYLRQHHADIYNKAYQFDRIQLELTSELQQTSLSSQSTQTNRKNIDLYNNQSANSYSESIKKTKAKTFDLDV